MLTKFPGEIFYRCGDDVIVEQGLVISRWRYQKSSKLGFQFFMKKSFVGKDKLGKSIEDFVSFIPE